jgi:hypothetical protein
MLTPVHTIQFLFLHHLKIYGLRNPIRYPSLASRIAFLGNGLTGLEHVIRGKRPGNIGDCLTSILARTSCVASHFMGAEPVIGMTIGEAIVHAMCKKYSDHCHYCGFPVCNCPDKNRKPLTPGIVTPEQVGWSCASWQAMNAQVYGKKNARGGLDTGLSNLDRELRELTKLESRDSRFNVPDEKIFADAMEELGDMIARIFAVANLQEVSVDVGQRFWERYQHGCPLCHKLPCKCLPLGFRSDHPGSHMLSLPE